ncbi:MAG: bifunctional homocysteine S-methyltransferase/methylenetetrahydrofolate reductase [Anaerolineaceae bacterium]|jgi:homocysteine S-methyltransferase
MDSQVAFLTALKDPRPMLCDGAMGTMLNLRGAAFDTCLDALNIQNPSLVADIHRMYIEAGAQIIETNTFGANRYKLARHGLENKVAEINAAGVELAKRVVLASFKPVYIAGSIGPLGVRLAPFGRVQYDEARSAFAEQIEALVSAGAHLLIIETMTDRYEVIEAIRAARQVDPSIPILASMTFTRDDRTILGDDPGIVARTLSQAGVNIIGVNCSGGPNQILRILKKMKQAAPENLFSVMPNAGWPEEVGGRIMYPAGPEYFGEYALAFRQAGAKIIGGCCGTTPQHIQAMYKAIQSTPVDQLTNGFSVSAVEVDDALEAAQLPTRLAEKLSQGKFIVSVEMDPPRGLSTHKLLAGASLLAEAGADVINVADSPMARMRMSPWAVCSLIQRKVGIETVVHFPTRGRNLLRVQGDLLAAHAIDVRNVFVVMGDPTAIGDYPDAMDNYDVVPSGLIRLIKQGFNIGVDHAGATIGQPTTFFVGCALNLNPPNPDQEIKTLRRKLRAGADFILTQPIFEPRLAQSFLNTYESQFGQLSVPLLVGFLPLVTPRHAAFLHNEVPGIAIPDEIMRRMERSGENSPREGIKIAIELIEQARTFAQGVYLMPAFNRFDYVAEIIEAIR